MSKMILSAAALAAATLASAPAAATVIDFDNIADYTGGTYYEDGYALSANFLRDGRAINAVVATSRMDPANISVVKASGAATTFTLAREDGGLFEFGSMDFGKLVVQTGPIFTHSTTYKFVFTLEDGSTTDRFFTLLHEGNSPIVAKTATFDDLGAISKFTFRGQSGSLQFDNIVLNDVTAAVPEPATWAMMLGGFGIIGGAMRRRRATVQFA